MSQFFNTLKNSELLLTYYLSLLPLRGHRPLTRVLQAFRSCASLSNCPQDWPVLLTSASRSLRQLFLGRPLFLFPWGFHERDCLVVLEAGFRSVCPSHLHRLWMISWSAGCWFVRLWSSSLLMMSGQRICRMRRRHVLMNVWIFFVMVTVVLHVSAP